MTISDALRARAQAASEPESGQLEKAAKKLESYSRAPGDRSKLLAMAPVLTPAVVDALGREFVRLRSEEIESPDEVFGSEFRQADYAFGALLIAAEDPSLRDTAVARLDDVVALVPRMNAGHVEHLNYLASGDGDQDRLIKTAAAEFIAGQPATLAEEFADALGLDLPREYWSLTVGLKNVDEDSPKVPRLDATIWADIKNYPGNTTRWNIRIGTLGMDPLGDDSGREVSSGRTVGRYHRDARRGDESIEGFVTPAATPFDFPRIIADLRAAHPTLEYDFAKLSVSGGPGRLGTAARKKRLRDWLSGAWSLGPGTPA